MENLNENDINLDEESPVQKKINQTILLGEQREAEQVIAGFQRSYHPGAGYVNADFTEHMEEGKTLLDEWVGWFNKWKKYTLKRIEAENDTPLKP